MDTKQTNDLIQQLTPADVMQAYSGKVGCMCGCKGKYYVTPVSRAEATENRGYAFDDDDVVPGQVTRVLRLVQAAAATEIEDLDVPDNLQYVYVELSPRCCVAVYLTEAAKQRLAFSACG